MTTAGTFPPPIADVAIALLGKPEHSNGNGTTLRWRARGSFKVDTADDTWFDHEAKEGGGVLALVMRERRCDKAAAFEWMEAQGLIEPRAAEKTPSTFYDYRDESGAILFRVERTGRTGSRFLQHGPDGNGGFACRKGCMTGVRRVPYRLPELLDAGTGAIVFVCEGEKDADRLTNAGLVATTNAEGAGKWRAEFATYLTGRRVVILEDNDQAGRDHAADVLAKLGAAPVAAAVLALPGLHEKGDVSDWLSAGHSTVDLVALAEQQLGAPTLAGCQQDDPAERIAEVDTQVPKKPASKRQRNREVSEDSIARAFTERYGETLRFDHSAGRWYEWTGLHWQRNDTALAFHFCRRAAVEEGKGEASLARASVARGVEAFARADPVHAVTNAVWDADPWKLGTPGGTVDLKTGKMLPARQGDMITRLTGVVPQDGTPARWLQFLHETAGEDPQLVRFLQQVAGYCLTGDTREHALFFIYGPGGNGKSVFLNLLAHCLGDYATTAGMDTFTASRSDRHPTDLAMLAGARLVTASETEEGRAWAEARIKQLTGGDRISARFMRQDFFEFIPRFKLLIVGNHAPVLHNVDEAARRRFNIVPFTRKPPRPDRELEAKLRAEAGQILNWAIQGCLDWQDNGLVRPDVVTAATADYFDSQDMFGQWIEERCETGGGRWELPAALFHSWAEFARASGDEPGSQKTMADRLQKRGFLRAKTNGLRVYRGLSIRAGTARTA